MMTPKLSATRQFWLNHIRNCEAELLTPAEYCAEHNLLKQHFYHYKSELRRRGIPFSSDKPANRFVAVQPVAQNTETQKQAACSLPTFNLNLTIKSRLFQLQFNAGPSS